MAEKRCEQNEKFIYKRCCW